MMGKKQWMVIIWTNYSLSNRFFTALIKREKRSRETQTSIRVKAMAIADTKTVANA